MQFLAAVKLLSRVDHAHYYSQSLRRLCSFETDTDKTDTFPIAKSLEDTTGNQTLRRRQVKMHGGWSERRKEPDGMRTLLLSSTCPAYNSSEHSRPWRLLQNHAHLVPTPILRCHSSARIVLIRLARGSLWLGRRTLSGLLANDTATWSA